MYQRTQRLTVIIVALVLTTSIFSSAFAQELVSKTHWAQEKMKKWSDLGIIKGSGSGDLRPDDNITRAEVATIINNVFGFISKSSTQFIDVTQSAWYKDELLKAREADYYNGYTGNISNAGSKITREDATVMLSKVFCLDTSAEIDSSSSFKDAKNISKYALSAVNMLSGEGIIKGYSDGNFLPKSYITRAEFITIMDNLAKVLCNAPGKYGPMNVSGHVVINQPSVELEDMIIDGNLYLTEGIGSGTVNLNKVDITHTAYISGGTGIIKIINSKLNQVEIYIKNATANLYLGGNSTIGTLSVKSPTQIQVEPDVKATLEITSDGVMINGQEVKKGNAIIHNGKITQNISETDSEIPAVAPTTTPANTPVTTSTKSNSNSSGNTGNSNNGINKTAKPTSTLTPTPTSIPTSTSSPTPTSTPTSTSTPTLTPTLTPASTPTKTVSPTVTVSKAELVDVTVDNLKEVVLNFDKPLPYIDEAENENNYSASDEFFSDDNCVINAELSPDKKSVTLLLKYALTQQDDILVTVKSEIGLKKDTTISADYIEDTLAPTVTHVSISGDSLLKLTFNEPVQNSNILSNYTIDGETFEASQPALSDNGKTVTLYLTERLPIGTHTLIVGSEIYDYAHFSIDNMETEFIVVNDTIAPTGILVSADQTKVVIRFSKEIEFTDMDNISTNTDAVIEALELFDDDRTLALYFSTEAPLPESGGMLTIKNLTDYNGNVIDFEIIVIPT